MVYPDDAKLLLVIQYLDKNSLRWKNKLDSCVWTCSNYQIPILILIHVSEPQYGVRIYKSRKSEIHQVGLSGLRFPSIIAASLLFDLQSSLNLTTRGAVPEKYMCTNSHSESVMILYLAMLRWLKK
jgi:hypothetical protein